MRITITEAEIKTAITNHIEAQGFNLTGKNVEIDLKATRGDAGYTADIDITAAGESGNVAAPVTKQVNVSNDKPAAEPVEEEATPEPATADNDSGETEDADEVSAEESKPAPKKSIFASSKAA